MPSGCSLNRNPEQKKTDPRNRESEFFVAEWTGLEPATPGVTGRYSNQLNYHSVTWWVLTGSNRRPSPCKGDALPAELSTQRTIVGAASAANFFGPKGPPTVEMPALLGRAAR